MTDYGEWLPRTRKTPATAAVYQKVRQCIQNLREAAKLVSTHEDPESLLRSVHYTLFHPAAAQQESKELRDGLIAFLNRHGKIHSREHELRIFRSAVEKKISGREENWTDLERLCMVLADDTVGGPEQRLQKALELVRESKFVNRLQDVNKFASERREAIERVSRMDALANSTRERIVAKAQEISVDRFACAVPLASLEPRADVVDENEGCCPICRLSYTDYSTNSIEDLLADYPVRIKYCGHVIGKGCLVQWMDTPKIDEAKFPYRGCPLCRTHLEGGRLPQMPKRLNQYVKNNRRAMETFREFLYGWDMDADECMDSIALCMSEEIAAEELSCLVQQDNCGEVVTDQVRKWQNFLDQKLEELRQEKWIWGFRGESVWRSFRDQWMNTTGVQQER